MQYNRNFGRFEGEFFVDVFNVLDDIEFGDRISWVAPRRFFVGVRASF